jgi:hypothetical protein
LKGFAFEPFNFIPGERIRMNNELYHLRNKLSSGKCLLEKNIDGESFEVTEAR